MRMYRDAGERRVRRIARLLPPLWKRRTHSKTRDLNASPQKACTKSHAYIRSHTYTHIHTHIYTHTHIHTHIHTHTAEKGFAPSQRPSQGWAILNSPFIFIEDCSYHQQHSYCRGHYSSSFAKCFPFTCSFRGDCFSISARSTPFLFHIILFLLRVVPRRTTSPCCPEI